VLDVTEFYPSPLNADGFRSYCKAFDTEARKDWGAANPERRNEIQRDYELRKLKRDTAED
jgi:hypothetical protein